jgi:glycerophosphoryl diester phosphodiesterase
MLPEVFLTHPIAHRGLHNFTKGVPENSRAAIRAAIDHGYAIEIDIQLTADDAAVVFHDYQLERLTDAVGRVRRRTRSDLATLRLKGSKESVPDLEEVLAIVDGQAPLLIELKDQDGALGDDVGVLEAAVATCLERYDGPVAVMSFNPNSVSAMQTLAPDVPRGLVTDAFVPTEWDAPPARLQSLARIEDFDRVGASFISHDYRDLKSASVAALKARGFPILCWTIRSPEEEAEARRIADNITFEGYFAATSA